MSPDVGDSTKASSMQSRFKSKPDAFLGRPRKQVEAAGRPLSQRARKQKNNQSAGRPARKQRSD